MTDSRRPLKHRPRERNFRFADYSKPQSKVPKDDRTLSRKGPQVEIVRPKWNGVAPMTFRPLPMTCAENPNVFEATRLSTEDYDFSDFIRGLPAVKYVGIDQKYTFLTFDPRWVVEDDYNPRTDNPYYVLYNAIMDAVKKTGEAIVNGRDVMTGKWSPLVNEGPQKAFNAPTKIYFMQGLIYESDGELYIKGKSLPKGLREGDLPQIIEISKAAGETLARKLNMVNPEYRGDTSIENQAEMYLYGDPVDLAQGWFVTLFNPEKHHNVVDPHEDFEENEDDGGFQSWGVALNPTFDYVVKKQPVSVSGDVSKHADKLREMIVPWDSLLYYPETAEICVWLARAFRSMPALLEFGWADNPEFFSEEVRGILANRTQVQGIDTDDGEDEEPARPASAKKPTKAPPKKSATVASFEDEEYEPLVDNEVEADLLDEELEAVDEDADMPEPASSEVIALDDDVEDDLLADEDVEEDDYEDQIDAAATAALERAALRAGGKVTKPTATAAPPVVSKPKAVTKATPTRVKRSS